MLPVFADPKTDFVFQRIFGSEAHKELLIALLNALLELDGERRIVAVSFLPPEQRPPVQELKFSIVDVKCTDGRGVRYVVEMQVLNVEAFEKRVVYNVSKSYVMQLQYGEDYPALDDVIGVTICDFTLWGPEVPMLSRWRMQEQHGGAQGLGQIQYVFLELPKYGAGDVPATVVEKWAYLFRKAKALAAVPAALSERPFSEMLEATRTAGFTAVEWDLYDREMMARQDARGIATFARKEGLSEGRKEGRKEGHKEGRSEGRKEGREEVLREGILDLCEAYGLEVADELRARLGGMEEGELIALKDRLKRERRW